MSGSFDAGVRSGMEKVAGRSAGQILDWALRQPEAHGAIMGAVMGFGVSPSDDRFQQVLPGAVIGAGLGHLVRKGKTRLKSVGGPGGSPGAAGAHYVGGTG